MASGCVIIPGPRDLTGWGTHALVGGAFPSGRAFGLFKVIGRDGTVRLEDGYVYEEGVYRRAVSTQHTPLTDVSATPGESVTVRLHLEDGDTVEVSGEQSPRPCLPSRAPPTAAPASTAPTPRAPS